MKTIYINPKGKITTRKIKKIAKKVYKIGKKEEVAIAICKELCCNIELLDELEGQNVLNRKLAF